MPAFRSFSLHNLLMIAGLAAVGLAIKPIINPMVHIVSSIVRIPGGSLSGGFLMMWMVLARVLVGKPGAAIVYGLAQGLAVMLLGFFGSHGVFSVVSYTLPGVVLEMFALVLPGVSLWHLGLYCVVANVTGALLVAIFVMQLPVLLLYISLITACVSGMLGGVLADMVWKRMGKLGINA